MSHAGILYGVTMEEGGVSKLISMKLEEFKERVA
jgi:chromosome segregation ATPase